MKKIISGLMLLFAALTLTSCIEMTSKTKLTFEKLPASVYELKDGEMDLSQVIINIDGNSYTLDAAKKAGAVVEGTSFDRAGYHTLLVTYNDVTITFTYLVTDGNQSLPSVYDTEWYDEGEDKFVLKNAAQLRGLAQLVNSGEATFKDKTVELGADIDLAGYAWTPIGEGARKALNETTGKYEYVTKIEKTFQGTFDGKGFVIKNLNDAGYVPTAGEAYENSSKELVYGYVYGLFGIINADGVEIKNVKLEKVAINGAVIIGKDVYFADSAAGIVGWSGSGSFAIRNCHVDGEINGYDAVAGIAGRLYSGDYVFENCVNNADVYASRKAGGKAGGIVGIISYVSSTHTPSISFTSCKNNGKVTGTPYSHDLLGHWAVAKALITIDGVEVVHSENWGKAE